MSIGRGVAAPHATVSVQVANYVVYRATCCLALTERWPSTCSLTTFAPLYSQVNHTEARKLHSGQLKVLLPFVSNSGGAAGKGAKAVAAASRRASKDSSGTGQDAPPTQVGGVASSDAATWRHVAFGCIGHVKAMLVRDKETKPMIANKFFSVCSIKITCNGR